MIKILADSTCDLPEEMYKQYDITVIPLKVSIANQTYVDKVGITTQQLFALIEKYDEMSVTSAPSPEQFRVEMEKAVREGKSVICITISSGLSASYQSAMLAAKMVDGQVDVVDTRTTAIGSGMVALLAARLAKMGEKHESIVKACREKVSRLRTLLLVDTVEYLKRGGRISAAAARMVSMLNIKPIIHVIKEGTTAVLHKSRGKQKAMDWMLNYMLQTARDIKQQTIGIGFSSLEAPARQFLDMLERVVMPKETLMVGLGSVVATHVGPNAFGVFYEEK